MSISNKSLKAFIELYLKQHGIQLSEEEAINKATYLLNVYRGIYGSPLLENPESKSGDISN